MAEARALQGQGYFCERRDNQTEGQEDSVIWGGFYFTLAFSWNRVWGCFCTCIFQQSLLFSQLVSISCTFRRIKRAGSNKGLERV